MAYGETLIIHHVEPMWGKEAEDIVPAIVRHLRRATYSDVILTPLDGDDGFEELFPYVRTRQEWSYAWEPDPEANAEWMECDPEDFIRVTTAHEVAYLYPWIKDL